MSRAGLALLSMGTLGALGCVSTPPGRFGGAVSAACPEAATAGAQMLELGGNAVDAAVATAFTLGVAEPAMSGLGGQVQILLWTPETGTRAVNGTSLAPRRADPSVDPEALDARRATTVPTAVATLAAAHRRFGSGRLRWDELLAPAIRIAEQGFTVGPYRARVWAEYAPRLADDPATAAIFLPGGSPPEAGDPFRQPALARTLRRLAEQGAEDFYRGALAEQIAADMVADGWLDAADLAAVTDPPELPPLVGQYRDLTVHTLPPPGGGWVVLQVLNMLETSEPSQLEPDSESRRLMLARALRIGHRSRRDHPVPDPVRYTEATARRIDKAEARRLLRGGETTHFSVIDAEGNAVAVTASLNSAFGAQVVHPQLGFLYNDYMHEFRVGPPGAPWTLRPGAVPYSSMSPTLGLQGDRPVLVVGSPGSERIISAVSQVLQYWADGGSLDAAVAASRVHAGPDGQLFLEAAPDEEGAEALQLAGYTLAAAPSSMAGPGGNPWFGGVHALAYRNGRWRGAADPRRDGAVREARLPMRPR